MLFRLRRRARYAYFHHRTRHLESTPPIPCDASAVCAVHTMLGARDLRLYLVGIKSLLRFYPRVAVVVHSDGTIGTREEEALTRHIPHCRVIRAGEADERAGRRIGSDSFLLRWRAHDVSYRRLIDTELWRSTPKRIVMDSDVIVTRRPSEVIDWIESDEPGFLHGQEPEIEASSFSSAGTGRKHILDAFSERVSDIGQRLGLPAVFPLGTTSGFYGCVDQLSLTRIRSVIEAAVAVDVPMEDWGGEQCIVVYLLQALGARRLSGSRYINYNPACQSLVDDAHVIHFFGTYRFHRNLYPRLAREVLDGLLAGRRHGAPPSAGQSATV